MPRDDPLAGWRRENLAAPKRPRGQKQNAPATQYDDDPRAPSPQRPPTPPIQDSSSDEEENQFPSTPPTGNNEISRTLASNFGSRGGVVPRSGRKIFTEEERSKCPNGDIRWPPPGEYTRPLHFLYEDKNVKKCIYYYLIHDNIASEARDWYKSVETRAAEASSKIPAEEAPQITIMNAFNSKKLRTVSDGQRGKLWVLDNESQGVWQRMKRMSDERGAVRVLRDWETFEIFGSGIKGDYGDILLVSQPFPADQVRQPP